MQHIVSTYLSLLDSQREAALDGLTESQIWQRPAPKEWCIGEILDHNVRLFVSMLPGLHFAWAILGWYGRLRRRRPYSAEIENIYKRPSFPMSFSYFWTPKYNPKKPIPQAALKAEMESAHAWMH